MNFLLNKLNKGFNENDIKYFKILDESFIEYI